MRLLLVGTPDGRARLRAELDESSFAIAGEFATLAEARASAVEADAILLADPKGPRRIYKEDDREAGESLGVVIEPLTAREVQVLELLAEGLPNKSIAARLGISDQTVKFHVASICGKLGAANRTDAVRRAVRRGLISL
jgi:DNA-binding NarL/FixJ family response regulator